MEILELFPNKKDNEALYYFLTPPYNTPRGSGKISLFHWQKLKGLEGIITEVNDTINKQREEITQKQGNIWQRIIDELMEELTE